MRVRPKALLDANVLWSAQQRNVLLQLAVQETIAVYWTEKILEEWLRNVDEGIRARIEARTPPLMRRHFPDATVDPVDLGRDLGRTDRRDHHVAQGALSIAPCTLVTWNVRDFDRDRLRRRGIRVAVPDLFLSERFDDGPELVYRVVKNAQANLKKSAPSWDDYLDLLASKNRLKPFVSKVRRFERTLGNVARADEAGEPPSGGT